MKKLISFIALICVVSTAHAQSNDCQARLGNNFTYNQSNSLCSKIQQSLPVYVPTPASTPAAASNYVKPGHINAIATFAANGAVVIKQADPVGSTYTVCNKSANASRVKAEGTPAINGGSSGNYVALATQQCADFYKDSSTNIQVDLKTVPTPAGP